MGFHMPINFEITIYVFNYNKIIIQNYFYLYFFTIFNINKYKKFIKKFFLLLFVIDS